MARTEDVAVAFAQGATKGKANSMFIEGNTIYSYGHHFPIAIRKEGKVAWFNSSGYSKTTAIHKGRVRRALEGAGFTLENKTTEEMKG